MIFQVVALPFTAENDDIEGDLDTSQELDEDTLKLPADGAKDDKSCSKTMFKPKEEHMYVFSPTTQKQKLIQIHEI